MQFDKTPAVALLALVLAAPVQAQTSEIEQGRRKAQACAVCHGVLGVSTAPDAPNLAGQPAMYVAAQLKAYRGGTRQHAVMTVMAKPLTDEDITQLAAWFASLRIEVQAPR